MEVSLMADNLTGYQLAKQVNERLEAEGLKTIPPQQVYAYMSKGMIATVENDEGKKRVQPKVAEQWVEKYVGRRLEKVEGAKDEAEAKS